MPARIDATAGRGVAAGLRPAAADASGGGVGAAGQIEQVLPFGVVELQGTGHRLQHRLRRPGQVPALQPAVVVDTQPGEQGDLLAAQTRHPALAAVAGQAGLLRG